jgi:TPR repeat protein
MEFCISSIEFSEKLSADRGITIAQFNYGDLLDAGDGIEMNKSFAAHYYTLSADQGLARAQLIYALIFSW